MRKVLIVHSSEELSASLTIMLSGRFQVAACSDGKTALTLIQQLKPEAVILDIMLPYKDGITLLEDALPYVPPVILAITRQRSDYVLQAAAAHGIGYIIIEPCEVRSVVVRLLDMLESAQLPPQNFDKPQAEITEHLLLLGLPSERDGFTQLRVGIPLFAQDTAQRLSKELYPAIAQLCGYGNGKLVEHSIREVIKAAWAIRNPDIWSSYFPPDTHGTVRCPTNKAFISRLAAKLLKQ